MNIINSYIANFSKSQMSHAKTRMTIYNSWITFKYLRISNNKLLQLAKNDDTRCTFIFGEKDKIISPKRHHYLFKKLNDNQVYILPFGHNKLVDNSIDQIQNILESPLDF